MKVYVSLLFLINLDHDSECPVTDGRENQEGENQLDGLEDFLSQIYFMLSLLFVFLPLIKYQPKWN